MSSSGRLYQTPTAVAGCPLSSVPAAAGAESGAPSSSGARRRPIRAGGHTAHTGPRRSGSFAVLAGEVRDRHPVPRAHGVQELDLHPPGRPPPPVRPRTVLTPRARDPRPRTLPRVQAPPPRRPRPADYLHRRLLAVKLPSCPNAGLVQPRPHRLGRDPALTPTALMIAAMPFRPTAVMLGVRRVIVHRVILPAQAACPAHRCDCLMLSRRLSLKLAQKLDQNPRRSTRTWTILIAASLPSSPPARAPTRERARTPPGQPNTRTDASPLRPRRVLTPPRRQHDQQRHDQLLRLPRAHDANTCADTSAAYSAFNDAIVVANVAAPDTGNCDRCASGIVLAPSTSCVDAAPSRIEDGLPLTSISAGAAPPELIVIWLGAAWKMNEVAAPSMNSMPFALITRDWLALMKTRTWRATTIGEDTPGWMPGTAPWPAGAFMGGGVWPPVPGSAMTASPFRMLRRIMTAPSW